MDTITLYSWTELKDWCDNSKAQNQYVYRGQGDSAWALRTSLARHFIPNRINSVDWRKRELKMYHMFRERLLILCPGMYDNWEPIDILSLMQHHGTPTRLLDFTYSPLIASYFALHDARGDSAIWVLDINHLNDLQKTNGIGSYSGPTHIGGYKVAGKYPGAAILKPSYQHIRLAAQQGCFLVPGKILNEIDSNLVKSKVILSESLVIDSIIKLRGLGIDEEFLFPNLDKIAQEVNRFSVTGSVDFPT